MASIAMAITSLGPSETSNRVYEPKRWKIYTDRSGIIGRHEIDYEQERADVHHALDELLVTAAPTIPPVSTS